MMKGNTLVRNIKSKFVHNNIIISWHLLHMNAVHKAQIIGVYCDKCIYNNMGINVTHYSDYTTPLQT